MRRTAVFMFSVVVAGLFAIVLLGQTYTAHALAVDEVGPFNPTSSLPLGSSSSSAVIYNDYIYQVAGSTTQFQTSLEINYAHINPDGSIGAWNATTPLPNAIYDSSTVVYNSYIYAVGGAPNGGNGSSTIVYFAPLNNDGTIGDWATTTSMPHQLVSHTAIVNNGYLYAVGGMDTTAGLSDKVYYAPINNDGTLGSWAQAGTIPSYSAEGSAVIHGGHLYVIGGYGNSFNPSASVYLASLNIDGSLSSWQTSVNSMPDAVIGGNAVVNNGHIYMIGGGNDGGAMSTHIYYAPINNDGTVGVWQTSATQLPEEITQGSNVVNNGYLYNLGGSIAIGAGRSDAVNYSQFITPATADTDNDTVLDSIENAGPNEGDANNDGTPDAEQPTVASFVNPVTNNYQVIVAGGCDNFVSLQTGSEAGGLSADSSYDYPAGLTEFRALCGGPGQVGSFEQYFYGVEGNDSYVMRKSDNGEYETMQDVLFEGVPIDGQIVFRASYQITDGGQYDEDGTANAYIVDPAGIALPVTANESPATSNTLADTGQSAVAYVMAVDALIAAGFGLLSLRKFKRRYF